MGDIFLFSVFIQGLKLPRKPYSNTTKILIFNSDICALSLFHTNIIKDILPFHSSMQLFFNQVYREMNEILVEDTSPKIKSPFLYILFKFILLQYCLHQKSCSYAMVAPLMIGLLDGRNPRICCLILNFSNSFHAV